MSGLAYSRQDAREGQSNIPQCQYKDDNWGRNKWSRNKWYSPFPKFPLPKASAKSLSYCDKKIVVKKDSKEPKIKDKFKKDTRLCCLDCNTDVHVGTGGTSNLDMHRNLKEIMAEEKEVGDSVMMCKACGYETREYHR